MEERTRTDTKRAVCRSFTNVISRSAVADTVDPKAFLMMLNTQFPVVYRGGRIYLGPLWDGLRGSGLEDAVMVGLFLRFAQAADELGIPSELPPEVAALSADVRQVRLLEFLAVAGSNGAQDGLQDPSGFTPLVELEPLTPSHGIQPIQLSSTDLKPIIPNDLKRRVSIAAGQAVRTTPLGARIESAQIAYFVDANFEAMCDGSRFDFTPMLTAIRERPDVTDLEIFVAAMRLIELLTPLGVSMDPPPLAVDMAAVSALLAESSPRRGNTTGEYRPPSVVARGASGPTPEAEVPLAEEPAPPPAPEKTREGRLRKWGLRSSERMTKLQRIARPLALGVVALGIAAFAWLNRPSRGLDPADYDTTFPLRSARLEDGVFQGSVDDARWYKLKYKEREEAVRQLELILKQRGQLPNLQIRDTKGRLVLVGNAGSLVAAGAFLRENTPPGDNSVPPEQAPVSADAIKKQAQSQKSAVVPKP